MNAGGEVLKWLYEEQLKVDEEWSIRTPTGFKWWADKQGQLIEIVDEEAGPNGNKAYIFSVRTEVANLLDLDDKKIVTLSKLVMPFASMSGVDYDSVNRTLQLTSLARVHDGIKDWLKLILSAVSVLQITEAKDLGAFLAKSLDAEESQSGPPERGIRLEPDELAGIADSLIYPLGKEPSRWNAQEFIDLKSEYLNRPPSLLSTAGPTGCTTEFPFGNESSLCQFMSDQPHPTYGNGLFILQSFPTAARTESEGARLALSLNKAELTERPFGYGFGSYVYRKDGLFFTSFWPNFLYRPGLLPNIYFSCAERAREVATRMVGRDWKEETYEPEKSGFGRLIKKLIGR